ncbi:hypothetical protein CDEST_01899 [Colletotrichum destructivum]|uniref:Uncharacterized protein n=1 Tax=Colletotrichum destructivum TaxID=34406 RepID=A0AAX4I0J6_9PEZI|nr:hypothetical protein CDEST_01899 [Colletotrichum destructivum]
MDEYEVFRRLATHPFCSATMEMLQCALRLIRSRYPLAFCHDAERTAVEFPPRESFSQQENMPFHITDEWINYMQTVGCSINTAKLGVTPSLWRLAQDDHVDADVITDYLRLLRSSYPSFRFQDPIHITSSTIENLPGLWGTPDVTTLVPCSYNRTWFAAIAYTDCVQLYGLDVENGSKIEQQLQVLFPRRLIRFSQPLLGARLEDSGVLMLLSMRFLADGGVPVQLVDPIFLRNARARLFMEMLMESLNVKDSDVVTRIQEAQAENSVFFDDAFICEGNDLSPARSGFTADMEDGGDFTFDASPGPASRSSLSAEERPLSRERTCEAGTIASAQAPHNPSSSSHPTGPPNEKLTSLRSGRVLDMTMPMMPMMPPEMSQQCRTILDILSEAVAFYRSVRMSESSELSVIWSAIKNGFKSEFYRRYSGVLFYRQMARLGSDKDVAKKIKISISKPEIKEMRSLQSRFEIWHDICQLRHEWGSAQYVLLCVLPEKPHLERMRKKERQDQLQQVRERLDNTHNELSSYAEAAKALCTALVQGSLPRYRLMIENYHLKADQELTQPEFAAYAGLHPRPAIPISRLVGSG